MLDRWCYVSRWNYVYFHCVCLFIPDGSATMMTTVEMGRMNAIVVSTTTLFGWFKRSLNQSIGSFSANPHFALLWSDERSDLLGNVSDHWGMVTYNFFRNIFFGSLIRTRSGAEFVMRHTHFGILRPVNLLWGSRSYYQMLPFMDN